MILRQAVQQNRIDIIAHAKGEDTHIARRRLLDRIQQQRRVGDAFRRQAIGEENDGRRPFVIGLRRRFQQERLILVPPIASRLLMNCACRPAPGREPAPVQSCARRC